MAPVPPSEVPIRPAATVVLTRDRGGGVEVLMVRRNRKAVFMGGAHVFPGGAVDDIDQGALAREAVVWSGEEEEFRWRAAGLRELFEEAGVLLGSSAILDPELRGEDVYRDVITAGERLDADALEYIANWVTPLGPPRRFDARFYVAAAAVDPVTDNREVFDAVWVRPGDALERAERGEWFVEIPTRAALTWLAPHESTGDVMEAAASVEVTKVTPRIATAEDGTIAILLPGDPGYEDAPA